MSKKSFIKKYGFLIFSLCAFVLYLEVRPKEEESISYQASLPKLGILSPFSLTNQDHEAFGLKQLKGQVWVASFFFSRCEGPCPLINQKMLGLQNDFADLNDFKLVSISVDPEYDQIDVLKKHAKTLKASPGRWHFLTGEKEEIIELAKSAFKVPAGEDPNLHSTRIVLIDQEANIRGYFDSSDPKAREKIGQAIQLLARTHSETPKA